MNEILPLVYTATERGLDIALFISTMQHMSSLEDCPHDQPLELNNIEKLIQRTEEILDELSARLMNDPQLPRLIGKRMISFPLFAAYLSIWVLFSRHRITFTDSPLNLNNGFSHETTLKPIRHQKWISL
jgi:hypothetical protein